MTPSADEVPSGGDLPPSHYAAILDLAANEPNPFLIALAIRRALDYKHIDDLAQSSPPFAKATAWAFEYHVQTTNESGRRRLTLEPGHNFGDRTSPPAVALAPEEVKEAWSELVLLVTAPKVRARLFLILWQIGGPNRLASGSAAIAAHLETASSESNDLEAIADLKIVTRLARAIADTNSLQRSLDACLDIAEQNLAGDTRPAGIILRALGHVAGEPAPPDRVDALLESASVRLDDVKSRDQALELLLTRSGDQSSRNAVWQRRVDNYLDKASTENSRLLRSSRLQEALQIANQSSLSELRDRAAVALQSARNEDLDMIRTEVSSRLYEAEFAQYRDQFIRGTSWQEAMVSCARFGPLSGNVDRNRELVQQLQDDNPLASLLPAQLMGPDRLPYFRATTREEKFELELVRYEASKIGYSISALTAALHEIAIRFPVPYVSEIGQFLVDWPGIDQGTALAIAKALHRFWSGDGEAAAGAFMPHIEAQIRELILASNRGIYRLQQQNTPGQFAGLGVLIPILADEYDLDESRQRFLGALLTKPGGYNLRNNWSHGIHRELGPGAAALLIHTSLLIGLLERRPD